MSVFTKIQKSYMPMQELSYLGKISTRITFYILHSSYKTDEIEGIKSIYMFGCHNTGCAKILSMAWVFPDMRFSQNGIKPFDLVVFPLKLIIQFSEKSDSVLNHSGCTVQQKWQLNNIPS